MRKVVYKCDICGKEMRIPHWMLVTDRMSVANALGFRDTRLHLCKDCAKWIKEQRGKGGDEYEE